MWLEKRPSPNRTTIGMFFRVTKSRSDIPNDLSSFQYILFLVQFRNKHSLLKLQRALKRTRKCKNYYREKIVALEDAINLNIRKTENVTNHVTEEFKQNIEGIDIIIGLLGRVFIVMP